jgi:hypothetical protein
MVARTGIPPSPTARSSRGELGELRRELEEVHEPLDFTERLLSQARDAERLP